MKLLRSFGRAHGERGFWVVTRPEAMLARWRRQKLCLCWALVLQFVGVLIGIPSKVRIGPVESVVLRVYHAVRSLNVVCWLWCFSVLCHSVEIFARSGVDGGDTTGSGDAQIEELGVWEFDLMMIEV